MHLAAVNFMGFVPPTSPRWGEALGKVPHDWFHLPGYLQASAHHEGGEALLFILEAGPHGMLVPLIRRPLAEFGPAYAPYSDMASPYGYAGPLYWGEGWEGLIPEMHARFEQHLREVGVVSLFLRLNPMLGASAEHLASVGGVLTHGPTVYLDLRDAHQSWHGINTQNRRFISRNLESGCHVRIDPWDLIDPVIDAYYETMRRLEASPYYFFPREFFHDLRVSTAPHFHLATTHAPDGALTGGVFFSEVGGLINYYLTGSLGQYVELSPNKLMINALRLWGLEHGCHTLHLGGGLGARQDSLFDFKVRFSKLQRPFSTVRKVLMPDVFRALAGEGADADSGFFPPYRMPGRLAASRP